MFDKKHYGVLAHRVANHLKERSQREGEPLNRTSVYQTHELFRSMAAGMQPKATTNESALCELLYDARPRNHYTAEELQGYAALTSFLGTLRQLPRRSTQAEGQPYREMYRILRSIDNLLSSGRELFEDDYSPSVERIRREPKDYF
jgi:hypothetical protein